MKKNKSLKLIVTVVALMAVLVFNLVAGVSCELTDDYLVVKGVFAEEKVAYANIESVSLVDDIDYGSRVGVATLKINSGTYTNDEFGSYKLYAYRNVGKHIVVYHDDGAIVVFNRSTAEATSAFYEELLARIS